jgi:hypothetical protein
VCTDQNMVRCRGITCRWPPVALGSFGTNTSVHGGVTSFACAANYTAEASFAPHMAGTGATATCSCAQNGALC